MVVELLDLGEIYERWGFTEKRVYGAVRRGQLHAFGRPGRQKYYSAAELVAVFGEPPNGPTLRSRKMGRDDKGGYPRHSEAEFEFEIDRDDVAV